MNQERQGMTVTTAEQKLKWMSGHFVQLHTEPSGHSEKWLLMVWHEEKWKRFYSDDLELLIDRAMGVVP